MLKILWKRGKIAPQEQFLPLSTIFYYLLLDFYVKTGIRFSLRDKRVFEITEVEITRVDCIRLQAVLEFAPNSLFVCFCKCIHKAKVSVGQSGIKAHHVTGGASLSPFTALHFPLIRKKILRLLERERDRFSSRRLAEIGCEPTAPSGHLVPKCRCVDVDAT